MSHPRPSSVSLPRMLFPILLLNMVLLFGTVVPSPSVFAAASSGEVSPAQQRRVETVFRTIVAEIRHEFPEVESYTIEVVAEKQANAWINQNNEIQVTTGLLDLLPADDELAGVIGHEIAHGTEGHIPHRINQNLWSVFALIALGSIAGTQGEADWGGLLHMRDLFMFAYGRDQESEADVVGMQFARQAGYAASGLADALQLMDRDRRRLAPDSVWDQLYRTHPSISQRVSDLRLRLAIENLDQTPLQSALLESEGRDNAADTARRFALAFWSGDGDTMAALALPGRAADLLDGYGDTEASYARYVRRAWADAGTDVAIRSVPEAGSDNGPEAASGSDSGGETGPGANPLPALNSGEVLDVRLGRPVADPGPDEQTPVLRLTLRRSARGWNVVAWTVIDADER